MKAFLAAWFAAAFLFLEPVFAQPIPRPEDRPFAGAMTLSVDASDTDRGIFRVRQTIPVERAGAMVLLFPEWLPGNHAPRGQIEKLAGLVIKANGRVLQWRRDATNVYAFHIDVPEGARRGVVIELESTPAAGTPNAFSGTPCEYSIRST